MPDIALKTMVDLNTIRLLQIWAINVLPTATFFFMYRKFRQKKKMEFRSDSKVLTTQDKKPHSLPIAASQNKAGPILVGWREQALRALKAGENKKAIVLFSHAIRQDSHNGNLYYSRSIAFHAVDDRQHMIADLKSAAKYGHAKAQYMLVKFDKNGNS